MKAVQPRGIRPNVANAVRQAESSHQACAAHSQRLMTPPATRPPATTGSQFARRVAVGSSARIAGESGGTGFTSPVNAGTIRLSGVDSRLFHPSNRGMRVLFGYLKQYRRLILLALGLATTSQVFSLLDPLIFRYILDHYAIRFDRYTTGEFTRGVLLWLGASVVVNLASRVALNFQDYFVNVISQRLGAQLYSDGIRHSLAMPYQVFEDQRSGETLGKLQKARTDVERFITTFVSTVPMAAVGVAFITIYSATVHWAIAPTFLVSILLLAGLALGLSRKIRTMQKVIVAETTALAGATTE
jgi:ABC-type bacteriocin/lantibiotic exporter with double-glycine peptidase domain